MRGQGAASAFTMSPRMAPAFLVVALLALAPGVAADPDDATPEAAMATASACMSVDPGPPPAIVGSCWSAALAFGGAVILPPEIVLFLGTCYDIDPGPPPALWWGPCLSAAENMTTGLPP